MGEVVPLRRAFEQRVSKRDLAAVWSVSERTIERWMKLGLPFERRFVNGAVRFVPSEAERWLRQRSA